MLKVLSLRAVYSMYACLACSSKNFTSHKPSLPSANTTFLSNCMSIVRATSFANRFSSSRLSSLTNHLVKSPFIQRACQANMSSNGSPSTQPVVLCGPSGVGKSTLIKRLFADEPDSFGFSVSHTTRSPRQGETEGVSYHYVTREKFEKLIEEGAFLEYAQFGGNYYGTSAKAVKDVSEPDAKTGKQKRALLDIDTQGVKLIKANHAYLHPLFIFIAPPSIADLRKRLEGRGTETDDSITKRLAMAASELEYARKGNHDVIVLNDDVDRAYKIFKAAIDGKLDGKGDQLPVEEEEERQLRQ